MPDRAQRDGVRRDGGPGGAALFVLGLIVVLIAALFLLVHEAPSRLGSLEEAAHGLLRGMIRRPFPNPERQVRPPTHQSSQPEQGR
jgi:hypothetical protein